MKPKNTTMNNIFNSQDLDLKKQSMYIIINSAVLLALAVYVFNNVIKKGKFTCEKYVLNTYIYICLSFLLIAFENLSLEYYNYRFNVSNIALLALVILLFVGIFFVGSVNNILLKHLVWLFIILGLGFTFYPLYRVSKYTKTFISALLTTAIIVILMTVMVFIKPELVSLEWGPALFWVLLIGIIMEIISNFFVKDKKDRDLKYKGFSYFFIILFTLYLLYDTKVLQENAKTCNEKKGADYISESLGMFLDIFNILVRIMGLKARE